MKLKLEADEYGLESGVIGTWSPVSALPWLVSRYSFQSEPIELNFLVGSSQFTRLLLTASVSLMLHSLLLLLALFLLRSRRLHGI